MSVEPLLVSVGSCHCMLWPYEILRRGRASSSKSFIVDYDKYPPHLQLLRFLRVGRLTLAALTIAILLANVLSVALGGLFSPMSSKFIVLTDVETFGIPVVQGNFSNVALEMYYALASRFSGMNPAPTWTTPNYYVVPFYPLDYPLDGNATLDRKALLEYQGPTIGIGVDIKCRILPADKVSFNCTLTPGE